MLFREWRTTIGKFFKVSFQTPPVFIVDSSPNGKKIFLCNEFENNKYRIYIYLFTYGSEYFVRRTNKSSQENNQPNQKLNPED